MFSLLKFYVEGIHLLDYLDTGLSNFYHSFIARIEITPEEAIKIKQMKYVYRLYKPLSVWENLRSSDHWKKETYESKQIILDLAATQRHAEKYAKEIAPYCIEVIQKDPTRLSKESMQLFLKDLQTSARAEESFQDFAEHLKQELQIFESIDLNMHLDEITKDIVKDSILIHPVTRKYYNLDHHFYHSLGLASPSDAKRFHIFLFRKTLFEIVRRIIIQFRLAKLEENGSSYIRDYIYYIENIDENGYLSD